MSDLNRLKDLELDALKEIANIGAAHSATAVSQLIGARVDINVPSVSVIRAQDLPDPLGGPEKVVAGIYFRIFGDAPGKLLICLPEESVAPLVGMMMGQEPAAGQALDDMQQSALKEMGNILCSSYLNALARFLEMQLLPSVPALAIDMVSSLLSTVLAEVAEQQPQALLVETQMSSPGRPLKMHLFLLPDEGALAAMLRALGDRTGIRPGA